MRSQKTVRTLCECAVMLALAFGLSFVKFLQLPFDGAITLASMLPIFLISIRHGIGWGLPTAFLYSLTQLMQSGVFGWGLTPLMLIGSILLDYVVAFTVLGFAGIFRRWGVKGAIAGMVLACALRFFIHFLSGVVIWTEYGEFVAFGESFVNHPVLYSICYNGAFMLPETVLTVAVGCLLFTVPQMRRFLLVED